MFTLLDRYLGRAIVVSTLLVLGVFAALFMFLVLVDVLPDYGQGRFFFYELARYVVLSQPRKLYEIFPVVVLIGTLFGLSGLALNSELIAMRAAGVSKARIIVAAMKTGLILVIGAVLVGEYIVPAAETQAQAGRAEAMATGSVQRGATGLWLRDGNAFVNIGEVLPQQNLLRVTIYDIGPDFQLRQHVFAERAHYESGRWQLERVRSSVVGDDRVETREMPSMDWHPVLTPEVVALFTVRPEALSMAQLRGYIAHLKRNNLDAARYVLALWQKLLMPLATALMILLAAPFVFRPARSGGLAQRVFLGIVFGLAFVVVHRVLGHLAVLYGIPPLLAAAAPLVLFFVLAYGLVRSTA
jgi:lipopolysaccharide export system permease protein